MSHAIDFTGNSKGNAVYANKPAWHGHGTVLDHAFNWKEALVHGGLGFVVGMRPCGFMAEDGTWVEDPTMRVTVRLDSNKPLGYVSPDYHVFQNTDALEAMGTVLDEAGVQYEAAGVLKGGRTIWLLARMPEKISVHGDVLERFALLSTSHDGSSKVRLQPENLRVECNNMLQAALGRGNKRMLEFPHNGTLPQRVKMARGIFEKTLVEFETTKKLWDSLFEVKLDNGSTEYLINDFVEHAVPSRTPAAGASFDEIVAATERLNMKRSEVKWKIASNYNRMLEDMGRDLTNAWLLWNAMTEFCDHQMMGTRTQPENRFNSIVQGKAAELKDYALQKITEYVQIPLPA